ncbi:hypothetical protein PMIN02_003626 [Paraphaeosphaeria minitans]
MADSYPPLTEGLFPQHRDHVIPVPSYPQNYDLSTGHNDLDYLTYHYAFSSHAQQPLSNEEPSHPQHAQYAYPYLVDGGQAASYMGDPSALFHYGPTGARPWQAFAPQHYHPGPNNYPRFDPEGRVEEMASTQTIGGHPYSGFNLPSYLGPSDHPNLQWPQQLPRNSVRHPQRTLPVTGALVSDMFGSDAMVDEAHNSQYHRNNVIPHPDVLSRRNSSYQRPYRQGSSDFNSPDRRHSSRYADGPAPLSEPGSSPRNHNRRSSDRYSTDFVGGPNGPIRSPSSRGADRMAARRQRPIGHPLFRRTSSHMEHPNVPSTEQLRELREKLRHLLPAELPEGIDAMCDICQKDYSTKHVDPSEDNEVAIQLPCKHVFGEHCIHTWFDTCKKHKNKITCPMCRKVLIEPRCRENAQSRGQLIERLDRLRRQGDGRPVV